MSPIQQMLLGTGKAIEKIYIDDLFHARAYKGTGSGFGVVNGIDNSTHGGMVWTKATTASMTLRHYVHDTERQAGNRLVFDGNDAESVAGGDLTAFNTDGYMLGSGAATNSTQDHYCNFNFRRASKFFDIVKFTGNGTAGRTVSHSLESDPGMIIVKRRSGSGDWQVYHRSLGNTKYLRLNTDVPQQTSSNRWNNTSPSDSAFTVGHASVVNGNGIPLVAYVFGHDESVFGSGGDQSVIKCDSYVGNGSSGDRANEINLGFEPQWLLIKNVSSNADWACFNDASGIPGTNVYSRYLRVNTTDAEKDDDIRMQVTSRGFSPTDSDDLVNKNGDTYIYCAVRRSDGYCGKPYGAGEGTSVFAMAVGNSSSTIPNYVSGFPVDFITARAPASTSDWYTSARLTGTKEYILNSNSASGGGSCYTFNSSSGAWQCSSASTSQGFMWRRHAGFDLVSYKGNSVSGTQIPHSCNAVPQMIWVKRRDDSKDWQVGHHGANGGSNPWNYYLELNSTSAESSQQGIWNNTAPTSTHFTVGNWTQVNNSSGKYTAILFCSINGISKVGSFTGNGTSASSTQTIETGFAPRFLIIKRTDYSNSYTGWIVFDTTRGWGSGNDQALSLNSSAAQSAEQYGEPTSTGFILAGDHYATNTNNGTYIYYAHS